MAERFEPIDFTTAVVGRRPDGKLIIACLDGDPPVLLTCSPATALKLISEIAAALGTDRNELFRAIDPGPVPR